MSTKEHPDTAAFILEIWRNPDDETTRVVFADFCEEQGDSEYAEGLRNLPSMYMWFWKVGWLKTTDGKITTLYELFLQFRPVLQLQPTFQDAIKLKASWLVRMVCRRLGIPFSLFTGPMRETMVSLMEAERRRVETERRRRFWLDYGSLPSPQVPGAIIFTALDRADKKMKELAEMERRMKKGTKKYTSSYLKQASNKLRKFSEKAKDVVNGVRRWPK